MAGEQDKDLTEHLRGLTITISDNLTGYSIELKSHKSILAFFEKEKEYWQEYSENNQTAGNWVN